MHSLRDKLIKAGLITQAPARDTTPAKREGPEPPARGPIPAFPPLAAPEKAQQRLTARQQLQLDKRLRQLATQSQIPIEAGECLFHFVTRKGKVRRLELSAAQVKQLEEGALAIVERPEPAQIEHSIVPSQTADEMLRISEKSVRFYARAGAPIGFTPADGADSDQPPPEC